MKKIGLFGGSFNPPHQGHLNLAMTVQKKLGFEHIYFIPTAQNPLKSQVEGPTPNQRLQMTEKSLLGMGERFSIDDQEVRRGGVTYTIETVEEYLTKFKSDEIFLILGIDKLDEIEKWKRPEELLEKVNIVFTSRPGFDFPKEKEEFSDFWQKQIHDIQFNQILLKSGRGIEFLQLQDLDISATQLRKNLRAGRNVDAFLTYDVIQYVKNEKIYASFDQQIGDYEAFTRFCGQVLFDKKAINVQGFDLRSVTAPCDFTILASGTSNRHAISLSENLSLAVKEEYGLYPQSIEGREEGRWVLLDYGVTIVHIFYDFVRREYSLEKLWSKGQDLHLVDAATPKTTA